MPYKGVAVVTAIALAVAGCAEGDYGSKQTFGGLSGAALGGLLGAQFGDGKGRLAATGAGVLIGALVGSEIGRSMDEVDRIRANEAVVRSRSAPIGETIAWNNSASGKGGRTKAMESPASNLTEHGASSSRSERAIGLAVPAHPSEHSRSAIRS
jgi:surface antigen